MTSLKRTGVKPRDATDSANHQVNGDEPGLRAGIKTRQTVPYVQRLSVATLCLALVACSTAQSTQTAPSAAPTSSSTTTVPDVNPLPEKALPAAFAAASSLARAANAELLFGQGTPTKQSTAAAISVASNAFTPPRGVKVSSFVKVEIEARDRHGFSATVCVEPVVSDDDLVLAAPTDCAGHSLLADD